MEDASTAREHQPGLAYERFQTLGFQQDRDTAKTQSARQSDKDDESRKKRKVFGRTSACTVLCDYAMYVD